MAATAPRPDGNPTGQTAASGPEFRRPVEGRLAALAQADIIILYFTGRSQSPICLLELDPYARSGKAIALPPNSVWRTGNVDIMAKRSDIEQVRVWTN